MEWRVFCIVLSMLSSCALLYVFVCVCLAAPDARVAAQAETKAAAIMAVFCSVCVTASCCLVSPSLALSARAKFM